MTLALGRRRSGGAPLPDDPLSPAPALPPSPASLPAQPVDDPIEPMVAGGYRSMLPLEDGLEPHLRAVIEGALEHPGRLIRARLGYSLGRGHGLAHGVALRLAIAVEYFHTASLLFDDLPAMDDATERRSRPCPHVVHGEGAAILGALAFVARGYALLWEALGELPAQRRVPASTLVGSCLGTAGVLGGQARDLRFASSDRSAGEVLRVAEGKTVALIRLTLLLPTLAAGADAESVSRLESLARSWGLSYQILDDFKDCLWSGTEAGKTTARDAALTHPNLPVAEGAGPAFRRLAALVEASRVEVRGFAPERARWAVLFRVQAFLDRELRELGRRLGLDRRSSTR
jgi:geranylgeranyl diphosphate synthase, type II